MELLSWFLLLLPVFLNLARAEYEIGVGIADVTGPIVEINFMGYGKFEQMGRGLHLRQWARTFIISDGSATIAFISVDVGMIGDGLKIKVIEALEKTYGSLYNFDNVILSATHTHSGPGGYLMYFLFDLPAKGFSKETFGALLEGIVKSVKIAHANKKPGKIYMNKGELLNANINRSPTAYLQNPEYERARYKNNTDTEMVQLKFVSVEGEPLGVLNWFPVHPTSMNNTNTLVSSDNVGYASIKFEEKMNPNWPLGRGPFVAAFASSNLGDVSPNIRGPRCQKTGRVCVPNTSSCPSPSDACIASGPGRDMFESTAIIADRLFQKAWQLWLDDTAEEITGPVKVVHQYVDMPRAETEILTKEGNTTKVRGCLPALGYSFAAGTTDGPGAFGFKQGTLSTNPMWNLVTNILAQPTAESVRCHAPKPILLATGQMTFPFDWHPKIVSTQLGLIGNVALIAVPGEFTTMAGRRMRNAIVEKMSEAGITSPTAIIAGLCNSYTHYITTYEEYQVQRYEGASTIFGPHTLSLYMHQYHKLLDSLLQNKRLDRGPTPRGLTTDKLSFITPVIFDNPKIGFEFGSTLVQPKSPASPGDVVTARFVAGNPRNNLMHGNTYCTIERQEGDDLWTVVATDANWETKVRWKRTNSIIGQSEVEVEWTVPDHVVPGAYRIRHFGHYKWIFGGIYSYTGTTRSFQLLNKFYEQTPLDTAA